MNEIENFIAIIRESHSQMVNIFSKGSCWNFFLILRKIYPDAIPYDNQNHIVTKINGRFYDITGDVTNKIIKDKSYVPFFTIFAGKGTRRAIRHMTRGEYKTAL